MQIIHMSIDLPSNLFAGITTLKYTIIVDEFFLTVPGWFFDMCMISLELKSHLLFKIYPTKFTLHRVKCYKILIDLRWNLFAGIITLKYTIITLALVSSLRRSVVRALHRHRKGVGSIPIEGPIHVYDFYSRVRHIYLSEFTLPRVKCHKILMIHYYLFKVHKTLNRPVDLTGYLVPFAGKYLQTINKYY